MYKLLIFTIILLSIAGCASKVRSARCIEFCESRHMNYSDLDVTNSNWYCTCNISWHMPDNENEIPSPAVKQLTDGGIK